MVAVTNQPRNLTTAITLLEDNPGKYFGMMLESVGNCADSESWLLIHNLLEDLHPAAAAQCRRIAQRRGLAFPQ